MSRDDQNIAPLSKEVARAAAKYKEVGFVKERISANPTLLDLTTPDAYGLTVIHHATRNGDIKEMQLLIATLKAKGGNISKILEQVTIVEDSDILGGSNVYHYAAVSKNVGMMNLLLDNDVAPHLLFAPNKSSFTSFHYAAQFGENEMVRLIMQKAAEIFEKGAEVVLKKKNKDGNDAMSLAVLKGRHQVVTTLLEIKGFRTNVLGSGVINKAIENNDQEMILLLTPHVLEGLKSASAVPNSSPASATAHAHAHAGAGAGRF